MVAEQPKWFQSIVAFVFAGLGSTIGIALLTLWTHEARITTLEEARRNDGTALQEIKADMRDIKAEIRGLRSDLDKSGVAAKTGV